MLLTAITDALTIVEKTPVAKIDLTVTISVIIALCAIISPILTSLINNHHQIRLKQLELQHQKYEQTIIHERNIYENYLRYAGRCIYYADSNALKDYGEYYYSALMIAPPELRSIMIDANKMMAAHEWGHARDKFNELTPKIYEILQTK